MTIVPVIVTTYRCLDCGGAYVDPPREPCCGEAVAPDGGMLLTLDEVAAHVQVTKATVSNWINRGLLPAMKDGRVVRVRRTDFDTFVDEQIGRRADGVA